MNQIISEQITHLIARRGWQLVSRNKTGVESIDLLVCGESEQIFVLRLEIVSWNSVRVMIKDENIYIPYYQELFPYLTALLDNVSGMKCSHNNGRFVFYPATHPQHDINQVEQAINSSIQMADLLHFAIKAAKEAILNTRIPV